MTPSINHDHGPSYYKALHGCLRRYFALKDDDGDGGKDADFGTAVHAALHAYHCGEAAVPLSNIRPKQSNGKDKGCSEAELFGRYCRRFPPTALGTPLLAEQRLEGVLAGEPIGGTVDWVGDFDAATCAWWAANRGMSGLRPGAYLIDWKTKTSKSAHLIGQYMGDPQFVQYAELWRQRAAQPLAGIIVIALFRYTEDKDDGVLTLLLPPPGEEDLAVVKSLVKGGAERLRTLGPQHATPTHCYDWMRACPLLERGCSRHNEDA